MIKHTVQPGQGALRGRLSRWIRDSREASEKANVSSVIYEILNGRLCDRRASSDVRSVIGEVRFWPRQIRRETAPTP